MTYALVALGGAFGAVLRYIFVGWAGRALGHGLPWGTFGVNVLGSFVMGVVAVVMMERLAGSWGRLSPLVMTGVLGGFTTFSAFSLDALYLIERGRAAAAGAYMAGSVIVSVLALWAGLASARALLQG